MDYSTIVSKEEKTDKNEKFPHFQSMENAGHEQVLICSRPEVGLKAIIAIHDTTLGPALGGTRMWMYQNEQQAMTDVLRLSRGMTYKAAISGLNLGGGKAVIIGDPHADKNEQLFRAFGRYVDSLGGRYITAEDVGMTEQDMEWIYSETKYVTGIPKSMGGSGDPSPVTAHGVYMGMKAAAKYAYGSDSLAGKRIALQGAGNVASNLARYLAHEKAELYVSDIYQKKANELARETSAKVVGTEEIYSLDVDIFSPCALGGGINDDTISRLQCDIIAGAANNILENEIVHAEELKTRGILFAPDYVINAGGIINISSELEGYNQDLAMRRTSGIYDTLSDILAFADRHNITTMAASNKLAKERIESVGKIGQIYTSSSHFSSRKGEMYMRDRK